MKSQLFLICLFFLQFIVYLSAGDSLNIGKLQIFPKDNPWNWDISTYEVHPNSNNFIDSIGPNIHLHPDFGTYWQGAPIGIPYVVVNGLQPLTDIVYTHYGNESDPGPFPIPLNAPIEGGSNSNGDRHVIAVDTTNAMLYEIFKSYPVNDHWEAQSGARYDLTNNNLRPAGWTSADAAGLPVFPGLVRYEEVYIRQEINHALRFTIGKTRKEYIYPARHFASDSDNPDYPPMGMRFRLKIDFDISGFSDPIQVILIALKKYGMIVADNGSDWFISGAPDDRWDDDILGELKSIQGYNFEAIKTVDDQGNPIYPVTALTNREIASQHAIQFSFFPNPFNSSITFTFRLFEASQIKISIIDIRGAKINIVKNEYFLQGEHSINWNPQHLSSGVYFFQLLGDTYFKTGKILYIK